MALLGKPKSQKARAALSDAKKGARTGFAIRPYKRIWTPEMRRKHGERMRGNKYMKGKRHSDALKARWRRDRAGKTNLPWSDPAFKTRMREVSSQNGVAVRRMPKRSRYEYLDRHGQLHRMLSSWEVAYAQWLDRQNYTWRYEPVLLLSTGCRYLPDFWVAELGIYVEVKGTPWSRTKYEQAIADGHKVLLVTDPTEFGADSSALTTIRAEAKR